MKKTWLGSVLTVGVSVWIVCICFFRGLSVLSELDKGGKILGIIDWYTYPYILFPLGCLVGALGAWLRELNFKRGIQKRWWMVLLGGVSSISLYMFYALAMTLQEVTESSLENLLLFIVVIFILVLFVIRIDRLIKRLSRPKQTK